MPCHKANWRILLPVVVFAAAVMCTGCRANAFDTASPAWVQVPIDSAKMSALQTEVDNGHRPGELDPEQVTGDFLVYNLAIPGGSTVSNMQDKKQRNGQSDVTVSLQDGRTVQLVLVQPVRKDSTGIWCVQKYRFLTKQ